MVKHRAKGFSLVELLTATLLAVSLSVAATEWYVSVVSMLRAQHFIIENNEVGSFVIRYLEKSISKAGAGLVDQHPLNFEGDGLIIRYKNNLPGVGEVRNCLANRVEEDVIVDRFSIELYEFGGYELKCSSSGLTDWVSEGVKAMSFEVGVDQGRFTNQQFDYSTKDGAVDGYVSKEAFNSLTMTPLAIKLTVTTYRPLLYSPFHKGYWLNERDSENAYVTQSFTTTILLPNS